MGASCSAMRSSTEVWRASSAIATGVYTIRGSEIGTGGVTVEIRVAEEAKRALKSSKCSLAQKCSLAAPKTARQIDPRGPPPQLVSTHA